MTDLISRADAEPKMTEEVREALMRLTMCAREECDVCKYKDKCGFEFQYNISTENMHTILEALSTEAVQEAVPTVVSVTMSDGSQYYLEHERDAIQADAVQGEWVRKYDDKVNCYWYECDQCGEYRPRNQFGHEYNANFCPNCGARMKGGAE